MAIDLSNLRLSNLGKRSLDRPRLDLYPLLPLARWVGLPVKVDYQRYLQSATWRHKAEACKRRAGYRCQTCNSPHDLEAHHRTYKRLGWERKEDLTCLCSDCHELFSERRSLWTQS